MTIISGYALRLQCAYRCRLARRHLALKLATRAALRIQASVRRRRVQLQLATTSPGVLCELKDLRAQVIANLHDAHTHARTHAYGRYGRYGLSQFSPPPTARPYWLCPDGGWLGWGGRSQRPYRRGKPLPVPTSCWTAMPRVERRSASRPPTMSAPGISILESGPF